MLKTISIIEACSAIFVLALLVIKILEKDKERHQIRLLILLGLTGAWLVVDSIAGFVNKPETSKGVLYFLNLLSILFIPTIPLSFMWYCDAYFKAKANIPRWYFLIPCAIQGCNFIVFLIYFLLGKMGSYNQIALIWESEARIPIPSIILYATLGTYTTVSIYLIRKKYKLRSAYIVVLYLVPAIVGVILVRSTGIDLTPLLNGVASVLVVLCMRRIDVIKSEESKNIAENNDRILALSDNFESLYDVDLTTLDYECYIKGQTYSDHIAGQLENNRDFFADTLKNAQKVIYPEDVDKFEEIMNPEFVKDALSKNDSFDHYYRLVINGAPRWMRIRIVYKNSKKDRIIVGVFSAVEEMAAKEREKNARKQLLEKMVKNDALFSINLDTDARTTIHNNTVDRDKYSDSEKFSVAIGRYISTTVIPYDRKKVKEMTSIPYIREHLEKDDEYSFRYRETSSGAQRFFEIKFAKLSDNEALMSVTEKDGAILEDLIFTSIKDDYFAIFVVDPDEGYTRGIKNDPVEIPLKIGDVLPHQELMTRLAAGFEEDQVTREYFERFGDTKYLKQKFKNQDKSSYVFKPIHTPEDVWASTTEIVLSRHSPSNDPAFVAICFSFLDKEASENRLLQQRLTQDMQMIGGLANEYEALFYVNLDEGSYKIYSMSDKLAAASKHFIGRKKIITPDILKDYGTSSYVHPEDHKYFELFSEDYLRGLLANTKKISQRFRRKIGEEYIWFEMSILKNEDVNERANIIFVGFTECGEELRKEQSLQTCFNVLNKDIPSYDAVIEVLTAMSDYYGSGRTYICEILKQKSCINTTYEYIPDGSIFESSKHLEVPIETISNWIDGLNSNKTLSIDADDSSINSKESIEYFKKKGVTKLLIAPVLNNGELVGYLAIDNPTKSLKDLQTIKVVASVAYSEILRRKENDEEHQTLEKLTDAFVAVYYGDFTRDYMHNWKIVKTHRDELGSLNSYSKTMLNYIRFFVEPSERERCYIETSPECVMEAFKTMPIYRVDMTDISLSKPHNIVMEFIKVSEDGTKFVLCLRNVTEVVAKEREQQEKLKEALEAADSANKSKTTFLFNMSHDIRTPMNAIQGFTDMAIKYIDNKDKALDCLNKTQQSGNMLLSLINSVLEVSRIESGHATLDFQPVDVMNSFANISATLQELAKAKEITLTFNFGEIRNRYVFNDYARVVRILVNIISNSIKYTNNGGKVDVYCEEVGDVEDGTARFKYVVSDNGIGMSEEFQKHVFEQFSREKTSTVSGIQGTGLGMSVVKSFVDLMKGDITCNSKQGEGTTFSVFFNGF